MSKEIILRALQIGLDNTNERYADMIICELSPEGKTDYRILWEMDRKQIEGAIELMKGMKNATQNEGMV